MSVIKRKRGRPPGTGRDDSATLSAMADRMAEDLRLRATTAIKRVIPSPSDADLRRLQVKWKAHGPALLANSIARRDARVEADSRRRAAAFRQRVVEQQEALARRISQALGVGSSALWAAHELHDSPAMRAVRELHDSPAMRAMRELHDSPAMRAVRELHDSPAMRAMRDLHDSPSMRVMRELHDSPAMQAARELQDSPAMRAVRELVSSRLGKR